MDDLYWLDQITLGQRSLVGNKALYLSHLLQKGLPVLPGFVVSTQVFRRFLESIHWLEPLFADLPYSSLRLNIENSRQLQAIAQHIRRAIAVAPLVDGILPELGAAAAQLHSPALVLRPSLVIQPEPNSLAPEWSTTNLKSSTLFTVQVCQATEADLIQGLKSLWAQVFSAKSLFYWQRAGIPLQQVNVAVVVQPIQSAIASGTVEVEGDFFDVRATNGLGMAISWGEVIPDQHHINSKTGAVQTQRPGTRTIAYDISIPSASHPSLKNPISEGSALPVLTPLTPLKRSSSLGNPLPQPSSSILRSYLLAEEHQRQYVLEPVLLEDLVRLIQRVVAEMGSSLSLEWVYLQKSLPPQLYLTQATPKRLQTRAASSHISESGQLELFEEAPSTPAAVPGAPKFTGILTGLAAAPGRTIARAYVISHPESADVIPPGMVLVASSISLTKLPIIRQAAAIVTEQGGMTSHSAILAREIGVPAVMAVAKATQQIQSGDLLMVDGTRGQIYRVGEDRESWIEGVNPVQQVEKTQPQVSGEVDSTSTPSTGRSSTGTQLMVSLSQLDALEKITDLPIDGIGLLRAELLTLTTFGNLHPEHWLETGRSEEFIARLAEHIQQFTAAIAPRPVFYRSLDLRSHEFAPLLGREAPPAEVNPTLGLRGTFRYVLNPALFDLELAALSQVQQSGYSNLRLLLPFVRTVEEFRFCRDRVQQAGLFNHAPFQLWIMAEVPSVLFLLPDYVQAGVQGVAIGTNDLTQLLLGIDRDQPQMALAFNTLHPVLVSAIEQIIRQAKEAGIPCSICGQAPAQYPELIEHLVRWGITSISVEPTAVEQTHEAMIRAEQALSLEATRQQQKEG